MCVCVCVCVCVCAHARVGKVQRMCSVTADGSVKSALSRISLGLTS
jgi:hypothetical protein